MRVQELGLAWLCFITFATGFRCSIKGALHCRSSTARFESLDIKWFVPTATRTTRELDVLGVTGKSTEIIEIPIFPLDFGVAFPTSDFPMNM